MIESLQKTIFSLAIFGVFIFLVEVETAFAQNVEQWRLLLRNDTGVKADDLHLVFTGPVYTPYLKLLPGNLHEFVNPNNAGGAPGTAWDFGRGTESDQMFMRLNGESLNLYYFDDRPPETVDLAQSFWTSIGANIGSVTTDNVPIKVPEHQVQGLEGANEIQPFSAVPNTEPAPLPSSIQSAIADLLGGEIGSNFIDSDLVDEGIITISTSLLDVPSLDESPILQAAGFTEMHLVFEDEMGSNSGIDLGVLNQGGFTVFDFNPLLFDPFGGFDPWRLAITVVNPQTQVQAKAMPDMMKTPEPTSTLSLLAFGTLGAASTLKRKKKQAKFNRKGDCKSYD